MFAVPYIRHIFTPAITTKTKKMQKLTLTNAANGNQIVTINTAKLEFTPAFVARIAKIKATKYLKLSDLVTIGKYTVVALGQNKYALKYSKNGLSATAAVLTIKCGKIAEIGK